MSSSPKPEKKIPALPKTATRPRFSENATTVLERRYLKKDKSGKAIEDPKDMLWRVAWTIAEGEKEFDDKADIKPLALEFYEMMANLEFLPNSPTLMNAGRELGQLSACFSCCRSKTRWRASSKPSSRPP